MSNRLRTLYTHHHAFLLIFLLFVSFRLLAIVLFRPGGFIADFSDYDFYMEWGRLTPRGYRAYDNLWTAYPPLFPALMLWIYEQSARIPPWVDPRLFFHTFLGTALLVFEAGNLVLIYRLAMKLEIGDQGSGIRDRGSGTPSGTGLIPSPQSPVPGPQSLIPPLLYALLFAPVYTLLGWFEPMPLFFMLLGLDLLLTGRTRTWGWIGSAVAAGLGFLTKLTPALLVPIAVRWLGSRLSVAAARREWFNPKSPGNLLRPTIYALIFFATVIGVGYPFVRANPALALSSFRVQSIRPPWQSLWAVLDGYFGYGLVPLDMRNLQGLDSPLWESSLPWTWITLGFVLLYLWLYTRPYDWTRPRTAVAFAAVSVIWLFLYSKGWSPQFVVWVLAFTVLLLPTLRGMAIAVVLMITNFVEANVFLILLPDQHWLLWGTVLLRTLLLILLAVDFLGQIWSNPRGIALRRVSAAFSWGAIAVALIAAIVATPRAARAYAERRLAEHPCREAIVYLEEQSVWPSDLVVTDQTGAWEQLYPWLRQEYDLRVVDDYSPGRDPAQVRAENVAVLIEDEPEFWWVEMQVGGQGSGGAGEQETGGTPQSPILNTQILETQQMGDCVLRRVARRPAEPIAVADVAGGPIQLLSVALDAPSPGSALHLVNYWEAPSPVTESYTVFTQLFDPAGRLVAQQDNVPVEGLAPTDTWQPGVVIRDPYRLPIPADAAPGVYRLLIGLYMGEERQLFTRADGRVQDFIEIPVQVVE